VLTFPLFCPEIRIPGWRIYSWLHLTLFSCISSDNSSGISVTSVSDVMELQSKYWLTSFLFAHQVARKLEDEKKVARCAACSLLATLWPLFCLKQNVDLVSVTFCQVMMISIFVAVGRPAPSSSVAQYHVSSHHITSDENQWNRF